MSHPDAPGFDSFTSRVVVPDSPQKIFDIERRDRMRSYDRLYNQLSRLSIMGADEAWFESYHVTFLEDTRRSVLLYQWMEDSEQYYRVIVNDERTDHADGARYIHGQDIIVPVERRGFGFYSGVIDLSDNDIEEYGPPVLELDGGIVRFYECNDYRLPMPETQRSRVDLDRDPILKRQLINGTCDLLRMLGAVTIEEDARLTS